MHCLNPKQCLQFLFLIFESNKLKMNGKELISIAELREQVNYLYFSIWYIKEIQLTMGPIDEALPTALALARAFSFKSALSSASAS